MPEKIIKKNQTVKNQTSSSTDHARKNNVLYYDVPSVKMKDVLGNQTVQKILKSGGIQAKLKISEPNDEEEKQADRIADEVTRNSDSGLKKCDLRNGNQCDEGKTLPNKPEMEEDKNLRAKKASSHDSVLATVTGSQAQLINDGGQPLSDSVRAYFEPRFCQSFSQVRIHTDNMAIDSARNINALAYTKGQDIFFGSGQYNPESTDGRLLIAHELTHVLQQRSDLTMANIRVQRQDQSPSAQPAGPIWRMPFGFGTAVDNPSAKIGILRIIGRLNELEEWLNPDEVGEHSFLLNGWRALQDSIPSEGPLTENSVNALNINGKNDEMYYNQKRDKIANSLSQPLLDIRSVNTSTQEAQIAEELHHKFRENETDKVKIAELKAALGKIKEYKKSIDDVVGYARKAASLFKSAKTIETIDAIKKTSGSIGGLIKKAENALNVAGSFTTLAGIDNKGASDVHNAIAKFSASLKIIDVAATPFMEAVPLFGIYWNSYIMPITEKCLSLIKGIARITDENERKLALLEDLFETNTLPPTIKKDRLGRFEGGQLVFNYMWLLMNDEDPVLTSGIEKFFIDRAERFNIGSEDKDKLQVEQKELNYWNPFTWWGAKTSPNISIWLRKNRQTVWAQLYGSLPYNPSEV
jgi:hypothetical protein